MPVRISITATTVGRSVSSSSLLSNANPRTTAGIVPMAMIVIIRRPARSKRAIRARSLR